jgi:nucleoid-associated protein YgaU
VREFIDDNTRTLGADRFHGSPAMTTPVTSNPTAHHGGSPTPRTTADGPAPIDADHESHPPVTPVVTPPATTTDGFGYTVAAGDNVWKISSKVYGDGKFTQKIVDANKDLNLAKLKPGMIVRIPAIQNKTVLLKLPAYADAKKVKPASTESAIAVRTPPAVVAVETKPVPAERRFRVESTDAKPTETTSVASTHKVAAGETLASIAKKYYTTNGPKTIAKIIEANKGLDPAKLKVGQEIVMPALTTAANK